MKDLIKIAISVVFILGAYFVGRSQDDEKHKRKIKTLNEKIVIDQKNISYFQDSIKVLNSRLNNSSERKAKEKIGK